MLYLLDTSVLINANNNFYSMDQVPEYWDWLLHNASNGNVKIPLEIYKELLEGNSDDPLYIWAKQNEQLLLYEKSVNVLMVRKVVREGYATDLTDDELEELGNDPFIIAYALEEKDCCVVTAELSKPTKTRQNRRIPDICNTLGIKCCNPQDFNKTLGFKTSWKNNLK